jgi:hypothetical protein
MTGAPAEFGVGQRLRVAATRILPLRFRRQTILTTFLLAQATAMLGRVFPTDVARGMVRVSLRVRVTFPRRRAHHLRELLLTSCKYLSLSLVVTVVSLKLFKFDQ